MSDRWKEFTRYLWTCKGQDAWKVYYIGCQTESMPYALIMHKGEMTPQDQADLRKRAPCRLEFSRQATS